MSVKVEKLNYTYSEGTALESVALKDISFEIENGSFVGIIGHTGSGKSTLIQHLNGLIKASSGKIYFNGKDIYADDYKLKEHRQKVGLVFQYPEHQLFEVDVISDVCFGPLNEGLSKEEAFERAKEALSLVGMDEKYYDKSPFELSGGQKRRVAIAGVLAMKPEVLILDEPTAGLDPMGREEILEEVSRLQKASKMSVVLVSHSMEDVSKYADKILVMNKGELVLDGTPKEVFKNIELLESIGLRAPEITYIVRDLRKLGLDIDDDISSVEEAKDAILKALGKDAKP
jgi:cobalt import ATP-binding protein cbiO 1